VGRSLCLECAFSVGRKGVKAGQQTGEKERDVEVDKQVAVCAHTCISEYCSVVCNWRERRDWQRTARDPLLAREPNGAVDVVARHNLKPFLR
jgi:hypothetical protein